MLYLMNARPFQLSDREHRFDGLEGVSIVDIHVTFITTFTPLTLF